MGSWLNAFKRSGKVVEQATQLVNSGYKEIVLTGIHTGGYGQDLKIITWPNYYVILKRLMD